MVTSLTNILARTHETGSVFQNAFGAPGWGTDLLYRRTQVQETSGGSSIAAWQFFEPARPAEVTLGNGLIGTWMNNARTNSAVQSPNPGNPDWGDQSSNRLGYDGSGRAITKRYLAGGLNTGTPPAYSNHSAVVGFTTALDRAGNKLFERHLHAENRIAKEKRQKRFGEVKTPVWKGGIAMSMAGPVCVRTLRAVIRLCCLCSGVPDTRAGARC
jgi:hypothetical protein